MLVEYIKDEDIEQQTWKTENERGQIIIIKKGDTFKTGAWGCSEAVLTDKGEWVYDVDCMDFSETFKVIKKEKLVTTTKIDEYLKFLSERYDFEIINECKKDMILFNVSDSQPFKYDIQICFNEIRNKASFYLNIPALNLKSYDIDSFYMELGAARMICNTLNSLLNK